MTPSDPDLAYDSTAAAFAALGQPARLAIFRWLAIHPAGRIVGEIQHHLAIPPSTLSHHLDVLRRAGLLERTREGKQLRYRALAGRLLAAVETAVRGRVDSMDVENIEARDRAPSGSRDDDGWRSW